ncbi:hypothetical protein A1O3_07910 [Capronia epimyces CBS 606.96]|uniref:Trafficking protein particle complex subunit 6B n=1 Tax=Capronia epimyces CBS 606.96 TaxID=1182542 RepID=W9XRK9_9EURO|nr:uncharacterized protein A1O3_07910 [Capronia epimyces CBS 606.96]EXJ79631.1 hypothetical protein A1O3_07910 [Capronia epimyces CBS 606.96]
MATAAAASSDALLLDPNSSALVNMSCFDLLLIELVPLAERMARSFEASLDKPALEPSSSSSSSLTPSKRGTVSTAATTTTTKPANAPPPSSTSNNSTATTATATTTTTSATPTPAPAHAGAGIVLAADGLPETDVFRDSVYVRLERLGFRVGEGLSERFSRDRPRFTDQLDVIKFLCKDLWTVVFKKQIDNLKTNHRGVFVLTDSRFRPFSRMSMANPAEAMARAQPHLYFPCGIIRGVLSSLGIKAIVQAETTELPSATFQIKTIPAK